VLPDEAAHSQYEMRSFIRSDSGVLYPTGQGRLAEPSNPVSSNTLASLNLQVNVPPSVAAAPPKPAPPRPAKERPKKGSGSGKGGRATVAGPAPTGAAFPEESAADLSSGSVAVETSEESRARQSRLDAYEDAIEAVLRKVQETDDEALYGQIASDFGNGEAEPFVPPPAAVERAADRDERQAAQIADTIDAVIARTFHPDSDRSPSPPPPQPPPVASPPPFDDEDEIIEVHSVSPLKVEVTTDDVLILPPPSPPSASPERTLAERNLQPEEVHEASAPRRTKKSKSRQPPATAYATDKTDDDFGWSGGGGPAEPEPRSPEIPDSLRYGIPESYVKLEELSTTRKGRPPRDDEDDADVGDGSRPLAMDAVESLMKLAGVAPPPKRLRISYGSGRDRTIEDTRDESEPYDHRVTEILKPEPVHAEDLEECSWSSTAADHPISKDGQKLSRDDRARNRSQEIGEEKVDVRDVSANVIGTVYEKPPGKRGRPPKQRKKQKAKVLLMLKLIF